MSVFISFCGIDGCGKSTQAYMLADFFKKICKVPSCVVPSFKPTINTDKLKQISPSKNIYLDFPPDIISLSLVSDLWRNMNNFIMPKLKTDEIIITERFSESLLVYGPLFGSNEELIQKSFEIFPVPDIYIFLEIDPETAYYRVVNRARVDGISMQPKEQLSMMKKAALRYKRFVNSLLNTVSLDIDMLTKDEIHKKIINNLMESKFKCLDNVFSK